MTGLSTFIRDLFTGPDGRTWAIGRVYSLPVLLAGLCLPFVMIIRGQPVDLIAAESRWLLARDLQRAWPTERGFDFLSDLQALFLP